MGKIKNMLFDFGNVLYKIAPDKTLKEFLKSSTNKESLNNIGNYFLSENNLYYQYESGSLTTGEFISKFKDKFYLDVSDKEFKKMWNLTLFDLFPYSLEIVKKLKINYKLYLLSNTNEIHYNYFSKQCRELFDLFDSCFFSHQIGFRKPDLRAFKTVIDCTKIIPEETLFIDDVSENIEAAKKLNIRTFHVSGDNQLSDLLHIIK